MITTGLWANWLDGKYWSNAIDVKLRTFMSFSRGIVGSHQLIIENISSNSSKYCLYYLWATKNFRLWMLFKNKSNFFTDSFNLYFSKCGLLCPPFVIVSLSRIFLSSFRCWYDYLFSAKFWVLVLCLHIVCALISSSKVFWRFLTDNFTW